MLSSETALLRDIRWTIEREQMLRVLWFLGFSGTEIARQLGGDFTRSAVLSKAHRLQLAPRRVEERSPVKVA